MKQTLVITIFALIVQIAWAQQVDSGYFKRHDTLFLVKTGLPFNGLIKNDTSGRFYLNGRVGDSTDLESDIWFHLVSLIVLETNDTFLIDNRNQIDTTKFQNAKYFYLKAEMGGGESEIVRLDTIRANTRYSDLPTAEKSYYSNYERAKTCPVGHHKANLAELVWGLPLKSTIRRARKGKVLLMGCVGQPDYGYVYYCKIHHIHF